MFIIKRQKDNDFYVSTVGPLKTDTTKDELKCPSYRGVRFTDVIFIVM